MPFASITHLVPSQEPHDCAITTIAAATGQTYADVLRIVVQVDPRAQGREGLSDRKIRAVLAELGTPVRFRRKVDHEKDYGLLRLNDHLVLLRAGLVIEQSTIQPVIAWRIERGYTRRDEYGIFVPKH